MGMRNRVTPVGEIVAIDLRGAWLGNRGQLHQGTEIVRSHRSQLWIVCVLRHKDWRLPQWEEGHFTVLFFHDEAVALAAGHRPCALCRRPAYEAYRDAWVRGLGTPRPSAKEMDRRLHGERLVRGTSRRRFHGTPWPDVPPGAFVLHDDQPALVRPDSLVPWTTTGYAAPRTRPRSGTAIMVTPPATAAALAAGYVPQTAAARG